MDAEPAGTSQASVPPPTSSSAGGPGGEMVLIDGGSFRMGSDEFYADERPVHDRQVRPFWIARYEVTNQMFADFVAATGFVTVAERELDPAAFPGADPADLVPGSMVFTPTSGPVDLGDWRAWWRWQPGADWRHPFGPESGIDRAGSLDQAHFVHEFREFTGLTPTRYVEVRQRFLREHPDHALDGWPLPADCFLTRATTHDTRDWGLRTEEEPMGKVVMNASVSVDGFIAAENDDPGPLFEWLVSGDVPLDDSGVLNVSQASYDHIRPYWDQVGVTIAGRHSFDITDGWDGKPPSGIDHVVVVTHRPPPEGWDPDAPFHFIHGIEAAVTKAQELAGDRTVEVAAGDVGGQVLAAGLVDEVRMDVAPVVLGSGKRYFGSVDSPHLLEDPDVIVQGDRVLHLRYRVRR